MPQYRAVRRRSRRSKVASLTAGILVCASIATVFGWRQLEAVSATNVSYLSTKQYHENLLLDTYDTLSSIGFFRSTAARLTRGLTTDEARLSALMRWTSENVRPQYAAPTRVVSDNAWELVRRGFGQCDQVNHIMATLATYAGYDARQLFLWKTPEHLVSPHSVAEVLVRNRWVVVDAWQGVIWRDLDGTLLSADDATPQLMDRFGYSQWDIQADWFKNGTEFRTFPYQSSAAFAAKVLNKLGSSPVAPPVITPQAPAPISPQATGGSYSPAPNPTAPPSPTAAPDQNADAQMLVAYDRARRAQLDGHYATAAAIYRSLLSRPLPTELGDGCGFWLGVALYRSNQDQASVDAFTAALARNASTPWAASIRQYRAEVLEELSDESDAVADYTASNTPTSRKRLADLGVSPPAIARR